MNFLYSTWLATPLNTRHRIAEALHIKKVRSTHVVNDFVQDDGYNIQDVEAALSVPNLQSYLDSYETDLNVLYQMTMDKAEGKIEQRQTELKEQKEDFTNGVNELAKVITKSHAKAKKNKQK